MIGKLFDSLFKNAPTAGIVEQNYEATLENEDAETARSLDGLRSMMRRAGVGVPPLVSSHLRQIEDVLRSIISAVAEQGASTEQRVLLHAMVCDYVPTPLRTFLALTENERTQDSPGSGLLIEQLVTLEATAKDLLNQMRIGAISELSTYGLFLADKFDGPSLTLDGV